MGRSREGQVMAGTRMKRVACIVAATVAAVGLGPVASGAQATAPQDAGDGVIVVTDPMESTFDARERSWATVFHAVAENLEVGVPRLVTAQIVVKQATARLYVGQQLRCVSLDGNKVAYGTRAGHNVNRSDAGKALTASFLLTPKEAGDWACTTEVSVCSPGACKGGTGFGKLSIRTQRQSNVNYSFLSVSGPLPTWANAHRLGTRDIPVSVRKKGTLSAVLTLPKDGSSLMVTGLLGVTNCITATDPEACAKAGPRSLSASSTIDITVRVAQLGTGRCTVMNLNDPDVRKRTISADQHHSHIVFSLKGFTPSTARGCEARARVEATIKVVKGNGVAFEAGSSTLPKSWVAAIPSE